MTVALTLGVIFLVFMLLSITHHTYTYLKEGRMKGYSIWDRNVYSFKKEPKGAYAYLLVNCVVMSLAFILVISLGFILLGLINSTDPVQKGILFVFIDFLVTIVMGIVVMIALVAFYEEYFQKDTLKPILKFLAYITPNFMHRKKYLILWFPYDFFMILFLLGVFVYYVSRILV